MIFGGFTKLPWSSEEGTFYDKENYIFSSNNKERCFGKNEDLGGCIECKENCLVVFGNDIVIQD